MSGSTYLTIAELAAQYGVSLRTLRFYEQRGLLAPLRIGTSRFYTERDKVRLALILKGKRLGFTLTEIEALIRASCVGEDQGTLLTSLDKVAIARRVDDLERERDRVEKALEDLRMAIAGRRAAPDAGAASTARWVGR